LSWMLCRGMGVRRVCWGGTTASDSSERGLLSGTWIKRDQESVVAVTALVLHIVCGTSAPELHPALMRLFTDTRRDAVQACGALNRGAGLVGQPWRRMWA
jgi:hypothetical protein